MIMVVKSYVKALGPYIDQSELNSKANLRHALFSLHQ